MAELRSFIFLDQLQPQTMCYLGSWIKGRLPRAGMAAQMGEYVTHAVLRFFRRLDEYERQQQAKMWRFLKPFNREDFVVGVLGLGRIGKRFAHYAQPIFKRVIAHDPYLIDGDFPQYVQRVGLEALFDEYFELDPTWQPGT